MADLDVALRLRLINQLSKPAREASRDLKRIVDGAGRLKTGARDGAALGKALEKTGRSAKDASRHLLTMSGAAKAGFAPGVAGAQAYTAALGRVKLSADRVTAATARMGAAQAAAGAKATRLAAAAGAATGLRRDKAGRLRNAQGHFVGGAEAAGALGATEKAGLLSAAAARLGGGGMAAAAGLFGGYLAFAGMKDAHKRHADIQRRMTRTGITGGADDAETRAGLLELRKLARDTALQFDKVQAGKDAIVAGGRDFAEALKMMPAVARTAQASGSEVDDIANSSLALLDHMEIAAEGLKAAHDAMTRGGEVGKFELKDMARYLPSMLPAAKAIGLQGQAGLEKLIALLQVIRSGAGTAEEAAASANNIFAKMESEETATRFEKLGVDLRKEMEKARKAGKDLFTTFIELSQKALKGDLSKLPQLFPDMEFARGMRALLANMDKIPELEGQIARGAGAVDKNLQRVLGNSQAGLDRLTEAGDRLKTAFGGLLSLPVDAPIAGLDAAADRAATKLERLTRKLEEFQETARTNGYGAAASKAVADTVSAIRASREREVRDFDDASLGARQQAAGWQSARHDEAAASAERDAATTRAELDARRAQAAKLPGHGAMAARVKMLEEKLARQEGIARAERQKAVDAINQAMPRLPDDAPWLAAGAGWRHPDAADRAERAPAKGDRPTPPRRPPQSWINEQSGGVGVPVAPLDATDITGKAAALKAAAEAAKGLSAGLGDAQTRSEALTAALGEDKAAAATQAMAGFNAALQAGVERALTIAREAAAKLQATLSFSAAPTITPRLAPAAPAGARGKGASLGAPGGRGGVTIAGPVHINGVRDLAGFERQVLAAVDRKARGARNGALGDVA